MFVSAILLAAGESIRMGRQKALLPWKGSTLLEYQLAQLAAVDHVREIIVVTGHQPDRITEIASAAPKTRAAQNANYGTGKVSSILTGLRAVADGSDAIIVIAVDQPREATVLRKTIEALASSARSIAIPAHRGRRGHPPVFARALLPELLRIDEATQGLRQVLRAHEADIIEVECDASVLIDLNRPDDVARTADDD